MTLQEIFAGCTAKPLLAEEPMAKHTSFRIGGPADLMAMPQSEQELLGYGVCNIAKELWDKTSTGWTSLQRRTGQSFLLISAGMEPAAAAHFGEELGLACKTMLKQSVKVSPACPAAFWDFVPLRMRWNSGKRAFTRSRRARRRPGSDIGRPCFCRKMLRLCRRRLPPNSTGCPSRQHRNGCSGLHKP